MLPAAASATIPPVVKASGGRFSRSRKSLGGVMPASPQFDEERFRRRMQQLDVASELFHPVTHATWREGRTVVDRDERREVRTQISGVRLQPRDKRDEDPTPERETQSDLTHLVASLRTLRAEPGLGGLRVSSRTLRTRQPSAAGARVKFGLEHDEQQVDESAATRSSYRAIRRAIRRAGLRVESPKTFDPATGLAGLEAWAGQVRLTRGLRIGRWWLLLLLLPLLLLQCDAEDTILGVPIETDNLIVVLDKSGSMKEEFDFVRQEVDATLSGMRTSWLRTRRVDLISYDGVAQSALGGLTTVGPDTAQRLDQYLTTLAADGGTSLRPAMEMAAREIRALGESCTVVVYTDGEGDESIREMLGIAKNTVFAGLGDDSRTIVHTLTPRLFTPDGQANPGASNPEEQDLAALATEMGGRFGPLEKHP